MSGEDSEKVSILPRNGTLTALVSILAALGTATGTSIYWRDETSLTMTRVREAAHELVDPVALAQAQDRRELDRRQTSFDKIEDINDRTIRLEKAQESNAESHERMEKAQREILVELKELARSRSQ